MFFRVREPSGLLEDHRFQELPPVKTGMSGDELVRRLFSGVVFLFFVMRYYFFELFGDALHQRLPSNNARSLLFLFVYGPLITAKQTLLQNKANSKGHDGPPA